MGHSYGGAFTLLALFEENANQPIFHNFIANDPSVYCDYKYFKRLIDENTFSKAINLKLHLSRSAQNYHILGTYAQYLDDKNFPWLALDYKFFSGENHSSIVEPSFTDGLSFLFDKK